MKVKEFIKTTLIDITDAVEEATDDSKNYDFFTNKGTHDIPIDFDLAVISEKKSGGKIGISVYNVVDGWFQRKSSEQAVNRIKFSVMPRTKYKR